MQVQPFTEQEIQQIRAATSGTHNKIHFNNAGTSLPADDVVDTVVNYLRDEALNGGYETEYKYRNELADVYRSIGKLINADPAEIAIVENASQAWGIAFHGIGLQPGDEVITCEMEYASNLLGLLYAQKNYGIKFKVIENDAEGNFPLDELEKSIGAKTKLIAATHIASATGGVIPVEEIGKIARKHNILYLVDACQSIGQAPVDVQEIGCDMLSVTGRKYLRAPRGTGFLYIKREIQDMIQPLYIDGHAIQWLKTDDYKLRNDAVRYELYEKNRALALGLGKAVDHVLELGIDGIWQRILHLAGILRNKLSSVPGITVRDTGSLQSGIVTFSVNGISSGEVKARLNELDINVWVGSAQSTILFMEKHHLPDVIRASVHYYNTEEEIDMLVNAVAGKLNQSSVAIAQSV